MNPCLARVSPGSGLVCTVAQEGGDDFSAARRLLHDGRLASHDEEMADINEQHKRFTGFESARIIRAYRAIVR